ncbi:WYL domain-containing protein [Xanthobacter sp. VNH20]|uniref:WYL domain-containing protein n=1 Tax=Xanthobacter sp. VNH20 TaxID=3156616 RepID=UPI0032B4971E
MLRFDPHVADAAEATLFHPSQHARRLADGRLEVQLRAGGQSEMAQHLFTRGDAVEIVRPAELRDLIVQELEAALARHRKHPKA